MGKAVFNSFIRQRVSYVIDIAFTLYTYDSSEQIMVFTANIHV